MKKFVFFLIMCFWVGTGILHGRIIGDVNNDCKIGLEEAIHALQVVSGIRTQRTENFPALAFYRFDEEAGSKVFDSTANELDGTIVGASHVAGKVENALLFGSSGARVELPPQGEFGTGQISIEVWIRLSEIETNSTYQIIGDGYYGSKSYRFQIRNGKLEFLLYQFPWQTVIMGNRTLSADQWYYVAVTFNGTKACTYINGAEDSYRSVSFAVPNSVNTLYVGAAVSTSDFNWTNEFQGIIDELRISNYERSAAEILLYYQETN